MEAAWDFSHLPTDALSVVFLHLFQPDATHEKKGGVPLSEFYERWRAIRGVCKHWGEVLLSTPPPLHLDVSALPEAWLPRLQRLPVATLRVEQSLDRRWSQPHGAEQQAQQDGQQQQPATVFMPNPLLALQLVAGLEGSGLPQPFWSLAPLTRLKRLHLQAAVSTPEQPAVFDSSALQGLDQLHSLSLGSFADFRLSQLPPSLRRLRLRYDTQTRQLSVLDLPPQISLDVLRLEKPGALGVSIDDLWGRVARLETRSQELLLGVPVEDPRLIRTFERPYREGSYVPPHIWGDEEADDKSKQAAEMTANHFLACLPSCTGMQHLCLGGPAAGSVKFVPVAPAKGAASLQWLWSVIRVQGPHNLYGLSGREMEARQQLFDDRLRFKQSLEECCIEVVCNGDDAAAAAAGDLPAKSL